MPDIFTKARRSEVMSRIRGRGNKGTELLLVKLFREHQITGWRRHYPIAGRPDFAFRKEKVAVFVDGCFWHGCPKHGAKPKANKKYWLPKLQANIARDRKANRDLRGAGWKVVRIWEHDLAKSRQVATVRRVQRISRDGLERHPAGR